MSSSRLGSASSAWMCTFSFEAARPHGIASHRTRSAAITLVTAVMTVLIAITLPLVCDALLVNEALKVPVVDDAVVVELPVGAAVDVALLELVLAVVAVLAMVTGRVVTVQLGVTLPLVWNALLITEALEVSLVIGADRELTVALAVDVALAELVLAVVAVFVRVPVP